MRPIHIFTCLALYLATWVQASKATGPYQTVYLWIAWNLDIAAANLGGDSWTRTICYSSESSLPVTATFDQFIRYVLDRSWSGSSGLSAADTVYTTIDIDTAADALASVNYPASLSWDKLYPDTPLNKKVPTFSDLFDPIYDVVNKAKILGVSASGAWTNIRACWATILRERVLENFDGIDRTLDLLLETTPFKGSGLTRANTVVGTIDFDKMLTDATGIMSQEAVQLLDEFEYGDYDQILENLGSTEIRTVFKEIKSCRNHAKAIGSSEKYSSTFNKVDFCG